MPSPASVLSRPWVQSARLAGRHAARRDACKAASDAASRAVMVALRAKQHDQLDYLSVVAGDADRAVTIADARRSEAHNRACREYAADNRITRSIRWA